MRRRHVALAPAPANPHAPPALLSPLSTVRPAGFRIWPARPVTAPPQPARARAPPRLPLLIWIEGGPLDPRVLVAAARLPRRRLASPSPGTGPLRPDPSGSGRDRRPMASPRLPSPEMPPPRRRSAMASLGLVGEAHARVGRPLCGQRPLAHLSPWPAWPPLPTDRPAKAHGEQHPPAPSLCSTQQFQPSARFFPSCEFSNYTRFYYFAEKILMFMHVITN